MEPERREAIVQLLRTRDDHLPEPVRHTEASAGFVNKPRPRTCPDCLANGRAMFDCETCGGSGEVSGSALQRLAIPDELPGDGDRRDPYAIGGVLPFGFDPTIHDESRARDRQIAMLERQTAPAKSEADLLAEANAHPYVWELVRRRMYRLFDYAALDRALEVLRDHDYPAYRALHAVYVYGWSPPSVAIAECERGLVFLSDRLPEKLRAPDPSPGRRLVAKVERSAGPAARAIRDDRIRELALCGETPAAIAQQCFVSIRTVYNVVREIAA